MCARPLTQPSNDPTSDLPRYGYPMLLDVVGRRIVIVGGGAVACRKANGLIAAGARPEDVQVVAPESRADVPAGVTVRQEAYRADHLDGAQLVFAATDSAAVNERVVADARRRGVLVCRADVDDSDDIAFATASSDGDFITPAKLARGPVMVTASAAGNPALAVMIRDELAARFDDRWARLAAVMQTLRPEIRRNAKLSIELRRAIFRELASPEAMNVIGERDGDEAVTALRAWLTQRHPGM